MYALGESGARSLPVPTEGVVLIHASLLFEKNLVAIWKQLGDLVFSITCERHDNLSLISNALLLIIEQICIKFGVNKLRKHIEEEPDTVELILSPHVRQGSPLLINYALHRFIVKAEDAYRPFLD